MLILFKKLMKKSLKIICPILIILLLIGIFVLLYFTIFKNESEIKSLDINTRSIVLEIGDSKDLKDCYTVTPSDASIYVMCFINDASFAEISEDNIILAKSKGETTILIKCNVNDKLVEEEITLTVLDKSIIPSNFTFEHESINISPSTINCFNEIICSENYNVTPTIEYSNSNVCEYNYTTGLITPLNLGTTTITVKFVKNGETVSNSFTVTVEENYRIIETNLTKEDEYYILLLNKDTIGYFTLRTLENNIENANIKLKLEFEINEAQTSIIQHESNTVLLSATSIGESILKIYCEDDESIFIKIKIRVS